MRKILIVDDNPINRQLLINTLSHDYDIIEASNGKEALDIMHHRYNMLSAVLLDIIMPEMDGYEFLRRVRANAVLSQIPIIMVTSSEDESSRVKALSAGANDFIVKPFNPEIVKHCLRNNITLRETASILNAIQKDKLTGLYNREAFFEKADAMIKDEEPGYYIFSSFDIDNFKLINDQFGSIEGDRVLKEISGTLKNSIDALGGICGRIAADNFAVLFPESKSDTDLLQQIQKNTLLFAESLSIVFSVGRYIVNDKSLKASAIYDRAYLAKQTVKKRFDTHIAYFDETMLEKLVRDQKIVANMENALFRNQFEVWFQPQFNHGNGKLIGAEALVRWRNPEVGLIPPSDFIPLFEQNGFVYELDKYVWREACRNLRKWIDEGYNPMPVSVNVSRYDIFRNDLIDVITGMVEEFRIPKELLHFEITESAFAKSTNLIVSIVKKIVDLGFTVGIDDFGSGYSSLNTLKCVPAQIIKLDMRFLEDTQDDQRGGSIIESVIRMTKWLGMSVIAEGVETKAQGDFLKSIGCSWVQGYLYAKPMPSGDYEELFKYVQSDGYIDKLIAVDNLDNNSFWNPKSIDSLIFNSYVGAACIYEYCNGSIEIIRATDRYVEMFGGKDLSVDELMKLDINEYTDKSYMFKTIMAIENSIDNREEIVSEFLFVGIPGCLPEVYVRSHMRIVVSIENRHLIYCLNENITGQRLSERKEKQATERLHAILSNINCGITATVNDDNSSLFLFANRKYYELLGYPQEYYDKKIRIDNYNTICQEDKEYVMRTVRNVRTTGMPAVMEYRVIHFDDKLLWLRSYLSVTHMEGFEKPVLFSTYADITTEKNSTQDLLDNLPCGAGICVITENDMYMTYLNRTYFSYFSHISGSRRTSSVLEVIHPDDREKLKNALKNVLNKGDKGSCVVRILDEDENYITFRISGIALQPEDGNNTVYVTLIPLKNEQYGFSEMLPVVLEKVMSLSSELLFIKDIDLKYICCSHAFAAMVGLKNEKEVVGKTDYDLFDKALADQYVSDDKALIRNEKAIIDKVESIPGDEDSPHWSITSKFLLYDDEGRLIGVYGKGRDITHIHNDRQQQQFLLDNIPGGIAKYVGKLNSPESLHLTYFSDGLCRMLGYSRKEYEKTGGTKLTEIMTQEYLDGFAKQLKALVFSGTPIDYTFRTATKCGEHRRINIKAVIGEKHGESITVNALFLDVTTRQETV